MDKLYNKQELGRFLGIEPTTLNKLFRHNRLQEPSHYLAEGSKRQYYTLDEMVAIRKRLEQEDAREKNAFKASAKAVVS